MWAPEDRRVRTLSLVWDLIEISQLDTNDFLWIYNGLLAESGKHKAASLKTNTLDSIIIIWLALCSKKIYSFCFICWYPSMSKYFLKKVFLPIFAVSVALLLLLSPLLYYSFHFRESLSYSGENLNVSSEQSVVYIQNVYSFLKGNAELDPIFTPAEKSHMQDVRSIFNTLVALETAACILFFLSLVLFVFQKEKSLIIRWFLRWSCIALGLFLLLLLAITIDFEALFNLFHQIFFPQGNWSFDASSLLVQLFPLEFFRAIALRIFLTSAGISLVVFLVDMYERKKK